MTQEEKAKAYDRALKRAKDILFGSTDTSQSVTKETIEDIFSELKESEDEKIINAIKQMYSFLLNKPEYIGSVSVKDIFEWLDKKGNIKFKLPSDFREAVYKVANFINTYTNPDDFNEVVDSFAEELLILANNINVTKLKSEIKRRIECFKAERDKVGASQIDKVSLGGRIVALQELLSFINSLSQDNQEM